MNKPEQPAPKPSPEELRTETPALDAVSREIEKEADRADDASKEPEPESTHPEDTPEAQEINRIKYDMQTSLASDPDKKTDPDEPKE